MIKKTWPILSLIGGILAVIFSGIGTEFVSNLLSDSSENKPPIHRNYLINKPTDLKSPLSVRYIDGEILTSYFPWFVFWEQYKDRFRLNVVVDMDPHKKATECKAEYIIIFTRNFAEGTKRFKHEGIMDVGYFRDIDTDYEFDIPRNKDSVELYFNQEVKYADIPTYFKFRIKCVNMISNWYVMKKSSWTVK